MLKALLSTNDAAAPDEANEITDKRGYGARWGFSVRHIDNLLAQGCPHLKIGKRRVRIIVAEADEWMREKFRVRRRGPLNPKLTPHHEA
jgi:predicted DNA-binding transcriptional regulator AlpA